MNHKLLFRTALFASAAISNSAIANIVVEFESRQVVLPAAGEATSASLAVVFRNPTDTAASLAGYTLFLDIGPPGRGLPAGVTFGEPAADYVAGQGAAPLPAAGPGSLNRDPAAGDLGLGQLQFSDGQIGPGESFTMLAVNLSLDPALASPGEFAITLDPEGQNSLSALSGEHPFTVNDGVLTLSTASTLPGDYNEDGTVDAADYAAWRDNLGQPAGALSNDIDGGAIGALQYATWKANYGSTAPSEAVFRGGAAIPEPRSLSLVVAVAASLGAFRGRVLSRLQYQSPT